MKRNLILCGLFHISCLTLLAIDNNTGIRPTVSPDGNFLLYSSDEFGNREIVSRNLKTGEVTNHTKSREVERWPAYGHSPDWILYTIDTKTQGTIWTQRLADNLSKPLTMDSDFDANPTPLPGTQWVIFTRAKRHRRYSLGGKIWDDWDLCCVSTNGGTVTTLTSQKFWRIDSISIVSTNTILFSAGPRTEPQSSSAFKLDFTVGTNALKNDRVTLIKEFGEWPLSNVIWHPQLRRVFFTSSKDHLGQGYYNYEIYSMALDGSEVKFHTALGAICDNLSIFPTDGTVLFTTDTKRNGKLNLMLLDSKTSRTIEILPRIR